LKGKWGSRRRTCLQVVGKKVDPGKEETCKRYGCKVRRGAGFDSVWFCCGVADKPPHPADIVTLCIKSKGGLLTVYHLTLDEAAMIASVLLGTLQDFIEPVVKNKGLGGEESV